MVKSLDGPTSLYAPAKRCETAWIKLKKDYLADGLADTIDVVPIAAWHGSGRKAGWLSPYLCAVFNEETEEYEGLCKVMTGFTDKEFEQFSAEFRSKALPRSDGPPPYYAVPDQLKGAPVWVKPEVVWELQGAELTVSPNYLAAFGLAVPDRGLSLRFPRFLRVRDDKEPDGCTSAAQLALSYASQARRAGGGGGGNDDE